MSIVPLPGEDCIFQANASELAGTSWPPVQITAMNDQSDEPDERAKYTQESQPVRAATMQADCNRGKHSWSSESAGRSQSCTPSRPSSGPES